VTTDQNFELSLQEVSDEIYKVMNHILPKPQGGEGRVIEAMRYSSLSQGKRLRPFLVVASSDLFCVSKKSSFMAAAAIEFIHTYSLIHDDLPALDDDPVRRGQPSCHVMFDEATAILAGDGLLTFAFHLLTDDRVHADPGVRCELVRSLSEASGCNGMIGGQMMDILSEQVDFTKDEIIRLQRLKTGELFSIACEFGAILGKAPEKMRLALRKYAQNLGLAFQITDDLLDAEGTRQDSGKDSGKESKEARKPNLVSMMGVERAKEQASMLAAQAKMHIEVFGAKADVMKQLADFVVQRRG
jgi:farnesyl diphosphate synthase